MNKIYIVDGVQYDVAPNREEEFLEKFPNATLKEQNTEKQEPAPQTTAAAVGVNTLDMGLQSADGSLESQDPAKGFFEQVFGVDDDREETYEQRELRQTIELENKIAETAAKREVDPETGKFKELSSTDKMLNSVGNMADQFQQFVPNLVISSNKIFRGVFGDEAVDSFVANESIPEFFKEGLSDKDLDEAIQQVKLQEAEMQSTGEITKGFAEGDVGEIAAGIVNGITSIGSSLAINTLTAGGGLIPDMIGRAYVDYNEALAEEKGKTISDLVRDDEDEVAVAATIGVASGLLERAGLKGAGKVIMNKAVGAGLNKTFSAMMLSGNKEGLTELFQTGLEAVNLAAAKDEDKTDAFKDAVFSVQGLESYLQGFVGGGVLGGASKNVLADKQDILNASSVMRSTEEQSFIDSNLQQIADLTKKRTKTKNKEVRNVIDKKIKEKQSQITDLVLEHNKVVNNMTENELYRSSKIYNKVENLSKKYKETQQKGADGTISSDEETLLLDDLNAKLNAERKTLLDIKTKAIARADKSLETNVATAQKEAAKLDNVTFKAFETMDEVESYLLSKDKRKTKASKIIAKTEDGTIYQNPDGSQEIIINKELAKKTGAINVGAHELLHGILYKTLKDNPGYAVKLGGLLEGEIDKINADQVENSVFKKRLELYKDESSATKGEEVLTLFSDATATGDIKFNDNLFTKVGSVLRRIFDTVGYKRSLKPVKMFIIL